MTFHFIKVLSFPPTVYKYLLSIVNFTLATFEECALYNINDYFLPVTIKL